MTTFHADDLTDPINKLKADDDELSAIQARLSECLMATGPWAALKQLKQRVEEMLNNAR
jgi:hypothetical protein